MDKNTQKTMFSSATGNWATPKDFFQKLDWRFGPFDLDPCASAQNTKCPNFFTEAEDGLSKDWAGFTSFVNPPEIHFVKGRLKFGDSKNCAPFPSAVVVFDGGEELWRVEGINR
jgi:site-specific DNA-methyltransferase (adenine-specific)